MIHIDKQSKAMEAIHDLIIMARMLTQNNPDKLFDFLDRLEYLPALILEERENTAFFEQFLQELCEQYDCQHIFNKYVS